MSLPFTPDDAKGLISDPTTTLCGNFINTLLKLPIKFWQLINYLFDASGNPTKAFTNSALPPGALMTSACQQTEDGRWLLCDGREVSQTTYADLYAAIGSTYGAASAGNFKIPDYRGMGGVGIGTGTDSGSVTQTFALGVQVGEYKHTLVKDELAKHAHNDSVHKYLLKAPYVGSITGSDTVNSGSEQAVGPADGATIVTDGNDVAHNNVQPVLPWYVYIIC